MVWHDHVFDQMNAGINIGNVSDVLINDLTNTAKLNSCTRRRRICGNNPRENRKMVFRTNRNVIAATLAIVEIF